MKPKSIMSWNNVQLCTLFVAHKSSHVINGVQYQQILNMFITDPVMIFGPLLHLRYFEITSRLILFCLMCASLAKIEEVH